MTALISSAVLVLAINLTTPLVDDPNIVLHLHPGAVESATAYEAAEGTFNVAIQLSEACTVALADITRNLTGEMLEINVTDDASVRTRVMATIDSGSIVLSTAGEMDAERIAKRLSNDTRYPSRIMTPDQCLSQVAERHKKR